MTEFTCPRCGRTSHHPQDAEHGYCGACHDFTSHVFDDYPVDRYQVLESLGYRGWWSKGCDHPAFTFSDHCAVCGMSHQDIDDVRDS